MEFTRKASELKENLDSLRPIDKEKEARIMQKLRLDWNYHSNHLEGNSLTFGETKALLLFGITAQGKPLKDHIEVTWHNEAINWIIEIIKSERPITENFIRELHTLLLKEQYEVDAITPDGKPTKRKIEIGKYKSVPNHVLTKTGETFRFATVEETPAKMHDLVDWYREKTATNEVNPILLAAEFHYRFITIHPFDDGNGRVARILMNFILMKYDFPPVIIKTEDKQNYFSALQLADSGQIEPFIEYIAQNLCRSLELMIAGAKGENIEEDDDLDKEIALLEQKLKINNQQINYSNITEYRKYIFSHTLKPIWEELSLKTKKFTKLYESYRYYGYVNGVNEIQSEDIGEIFKFLDQEITHTTIALSIGVGYQNLKNYNLVDGSFSNMISLIFEDKSYIIYEIEKSNNELLEGFEKANIINQEIQRHKTFLETKIKEIENKKSSQN